MDKLEALLIGGYWPEVMEVTFGLLIRAGFAVDVISNSTAFRKSGAMRDYVLAKKRELVVEAAAEKIKKEYTLVVVGDDATLGMILNSDLSREQKLRLLPVLSGKNFGHIFSKIGLSLALNENGISTPDSLIARDEEELNSSARALGYPILVKLDSSAGGLGVFECRHGADVEALGKTLARYPVLVQRKIAGAEVALEAFYRNGELVHFAYSVPEKSKYKFGPTSVRSYWQLACLEKSVFDELRVLGKALGAHGFVSIGCIHSVQDSKRYYFEADMRPNLWIDHSRYVGEDWAVIISRHFATRNSVKHSYTFNPQYSNPLLISHYLRLSLAELVLNRYQVWKYLPGNFLYALVQYRILARAVSYMGKVYRFLLPRKVRQFFKRDRQQLHSCFARRSGNGYANEVGDSVTTLPPTVRLEDKG
jgi:hypothetical protein